MSLDDVPLLESTDSIPHRPIGDADFLGDVDGGQVAGVSLKELEDGAVNIIERGVLRAGTHSNHFHAE